MSTTEFQRFPSIKGYDDISLLDVAVVFAENLRLLVFGPLFCGLVTLAIAFIIPPTFTARTSFLPPAQQQTAAAALIAQLGAIPGALASAAGIKNPADQYVALLKSTSIADRLIERFRLMELYEVNFRHDARKELANNTSISAGRDGLIVLEFEDESPQRAAEIANAYISELETLMNRLSLTEAQHRRAFFEKQLEEARGNLTKAEQALAAVGISLSAIKANPGAAVEGVATLQARVTAQEIRLKVLRGFLTESAPEFVQAQNELAALRSQLQRQEASEPSAKQDGGYIDRYRNFKYHETLFELFARQFELAKVDEAREGAVIQVVDKALPPDRKSKPQRALLAVLATLVSGVLLMLFVFFRDLARAAAHDPERAGKLTTIRSSIRGLLTRD